MRRALLPHWTDIWPELIDRAQCAPALHIGSGFSPIAGAITVDLNPMASPDVQWDLNIVPWPFSDNSFDTVIALSIVEHLDDFLGTMEEIHRISRDGALVNILVPHFSSAAAYVDPTHKQYLSARSCDYFISGSDIEKEFGFYVPWRYEKIHCFVTVASAWRYWPGAEWLANKFPAFWEEYLCYAVRGAGIFWQLRVKK